LERQTKRASHLCYEANKLEGALGELQSKSGLLAEPPKSAVAFEGRQIA